MLTLFSCLSIAERSHGGVTCCNFFLTRQSQMQRTSAIRKGGTLALIQMSLRDARAPVKRLA
jgi:hypothetical protein